MNSVSVRASGLPGFKEGLGMALRSALRRPGLFLAILYSIAICFERAVEVEVFKPYRLLGAAMILLMVLRGKTRVDRFGRLSMMFVSLGFLVALGNLILNSGNYSVLILTALLWAFNILSYIALFSLLRDRREIAIVAVVHSVAMLFAAYGIAGSGITDLDLSGRQFGDFKNPANACISMLFATLILMSLFRGWARGRRGFAIAIAVPAMVVVPAFMFYASTLTGSRAGAGLLLFGLLCYLALTAKRRFAAMAMVTAVLVMVATLFAPALPTQQGAWLSERNILAARIEKKGLDTDRLYLWRAGLDAFVDTYGAGLGMAGYQRVHKEYFAPYARKSDIRWLNSNLTLHDDYVSALVEFGLLGALLLFLMCRQLARSVRRIPERPIRAIAIATLAGVAINGISHTGLAYFGVWFYFALISGWAAAGQGAGTPDPARAYALR